MFNPCLQVPANLVQIVDITKKDGTPLEFDDWRRKRIGIVMLCWIAGGLHLPDAVFQGPFHDKGWDGSGSGLVLAGKCVDWEEASCRSGKRNL